MRLSYPSLAFCSGVSRSACARGPKGHAMLPARGEMSPHPSMVAAGEGKALPRTSNAAKGNAYRLSVGPHGRQARGESAQAESTRLTMLSEVKGLAPCCLVTSSVYPQLVTPMTTL